MTRGAFDEFIDDYFSECDEHLATVRRVLLSLESASDLEPARLDELARALHTLKGLSGMVGLAAAEEVAHAMEDVVRAMKGAGAATPELLELLFAGARLLEATIEARRGGPDAPSPGPFVDRVSDVVRRGQTPAPASAGVATTAMAAPGSASHALTIQPLGANVHRFEFSPSAELAGRGVGVEIIRQRLASIGEIKSTTPRVRPEGGVVFEFVVALRDDTRPPEAWRTDGLSWAADAKPPATPRVDTGAPVAPSAPTASNVVRVDLSRLDDLMRMVGELVVSRSRLAESLARASDGASSLAWDDLNEVNERIERQLRTIREGVMRIRLVPVGEVFERMRFAMRDIARESGKTIHLEVSGQETEIDKLVVDRMLEPLLHLVRNSASHGIENPSERRSRGKPAEGTIMLRARTAGDRLVLEIEDDGAGIDVQRVARRAVELGLVNGAEDLLPDVLLDVICTPGFSTRETADMASGRGVGMAVVRTTVRGLGGELFVHSVLGAGTRFTIELPQTLMITDALIFEVGDQSMAIPQMALREIVQYDESLVTRFENNEVLTYRGGVVPLVNLGAMFKLAARPNAPRHVLIVGTETHLAGLVVDRLAGLREIVVHPLSDPLVAVPGVAGATELADGRVSLILDAAALVRRSRDAGHTRRHLSRSRAPEITAATALKENAWS